MNDKTKKIIIRTLAAAVITVVYSRIAYVGNIIALISLYFSAAFDNDIVTWALVFTPPVLLFTFIDNLLFEPLLKFFGHPAWVYVVLSGNFMTLYGIFAMIDGFSSNERYSGLENIAASLLAVLLAVPTASLLGGVLLCFLVQLFKKIKSKEAVGSESEKEYAE